MPNRTGPLERFIRQLQSGAPRTRGVQALVQDGYDVIAILNEQGAIRYASPAMERLLGRSPKSAVGKKLIEIVREDQRQSLTDTLGETRKHPGTPQAFLFHFAHKNGSWRLLEGVARHLGRELRLPGVVLNAHDITEQSAAEEQILRDAMHDRLTNLPNRNLFLDRLAHTTQRRNKEKLFAVLCADLIQFEAVSSSLGPSAADDLLVQLARRLEDRLRSGDTVARIAESEFALLLDEIRDVSDATRVADRIQERLKPPFSVAGQEVFANVSIGIALSSTARARSEEILRDAEVAMHRARGMAGAPYLMFDAAMHDRAVARLQLEGDLRRALQRQEFICLYQPIRLIENRTLVGFEALVRWAHPTRGRLAPAEFIQVAEETGLIVPLGWWVLGEACRQLHEWQQQESAARALTMSVNVSVKQFSQPEFAGGVLTVLQETGLDPTLLRLEITESMLLDFETTRAMLGNLRALGIHLAIDDFGTGYSSLSYLSRLPIGMLKIDRSFVSKGGEGLSEPEVVRSVLALAASLGLGVTAEGIETEIQLAELRALTCSLGQGYYVGYPVTAQEALELIRSQARAASQTGPST